MVVLPIAILLGSAFALLPLAMTGQRFYYFAMQYCLVIGAIGAWVAAALGWCLGGFDWTDPYWVKATHRWLGTSTAAWAALILLLYHRSLAGSRRAVPWALYIAILVGAGLVTVTAYYGGAMVFGLQHYAW